MSETAQNSPQYIRYKDIVLQKGKKYREKNKKKIKRTCKKQIQKLKLYFFEIILYKKVYKQIKIEISFSHDQRCVGSPQNTLLKGSRFKH